MYQIIHTIYQTQQVVLHQARNGNIPMVSLTINKKINLLPLAACGGLCLKLMKELGARLEVTNHTIVLIEDARISDYQTQLYFIGELFTPADKKPETIKKYLQILHKAYTSLLTQNQPLDFSIYNLYLVQDQLKVLDVGCFQNNQSSSPVHQLAMLILKLFLPRQQYKPLKYMNNDQQINYVRKFGDFDILIPLLEDSHKRISWENLTYYLEYHKSESSHQIQTTQSLNSYNLTIQRIQSNIRSRSRRHVGSLYEQNKTNESTTNQSKTITIIRPSSIQSTPMNKKTEGHYRPSPQNNNQQFKTEISYQTLQPPIYDNFFNQTQSISPQETTTASTLQQFQEKSIQQHEKIIFKMPKSIRFRDDNEFDNHIAKYKHYLECLNFVGKAIAKCISILDAKNNLWMMPLFIVFKRMYQLRKQLQDILNNKQNIFKINNFFQFIECNHYIQFQTELCTTNDIVKNEVQTLLQNCEFKLDKLDQRNQKKIQPLLNLDVNQNLREISFVYLYQQIYAQLKKMMAEKPKQAQELRDLVIKIQCSLLILDQSAEQFEFEMSEYNNRKLEEVFRQENEQKLEIIKQRIQKNGYQIFN